jgi:hypothetical protein
MDRPEGLDAMGEAAFVVQALSGRSVRGTETSRREAPASPSEGCYVLICSPNLLLCSADAVASAARLVALSDMAPFKVYLQMTPDSANDVVHGIGPHLQSTTLRISRQVRQRSRTLPHDILGRYRPA